MPEKNKEKPKSIIILYEDFKAGVVGTTNEYIDKLPAIFMAEFFDKLASEFRGLAQQQLVAETTKESEDKTDE